MKINWVLFGFIIFAAGISSLAQDERLVRDFLTGKLARGKNRAEKHRYDFRVRTGRYRFDFDKDGRKESFFFAKQDGEDWLFIYDYLGNEVFRYQFDALGPLSRAYKIEARYLSRRHRVFLIYFFEGRTEYLKFQGTARLYLLTIDRKDLKTLKMAKGPYIWDEYSDGKGHYHQRSNLISLFDFDNDGIREVAVKYHLITRVFQYRESGHWVGFDGSLP